MKHPIPKLLSALLTLAMLTALFPAASAAMTVFEYQPKVYDNYANGMSLLLIGVEGAPAEAKYDGQKMLEVTPANYKLDDFDCTHMYAIVVDTVDMDLLTVTKMTDPTPSKILPGLLYYDCDVDRSGGVNIRDAQTVANIMAGRMAPTDTNMKAWLLADADTNGKVDTADILAILAAANR